jgi:hypothetical protein
MNLVKAQRLAEGLPVPKLKEYANGLNPRMIPPWLATGVIDAKNKAEELAATQAGAAQGEQLSVKEQVEQRAGLLGLQQAQQGAQQQAMMQPRPMAGPVPTGTPQPEAQPQPAGLDQLQSNIKMAGGGIVAFAAGDKVKAGPEFIKFLQSMGIDYTDFVKSPAAAQDNIKDMFRSVQGSQPAAQAAPTPQTVQGNASPKAFAAGQAMRPAIAAAKDIAKTKLVPGANVGLAAYQGLSEVSDAQGFYDDPNVPMAEKIKQFARTGSRTALPIAGGAAGSLVAPVAGTIGGAAVGQGLASLIDQEGDALKKYRESQKGDIASENARLAAKAPAPASDMGTEGRRTGQVAMGNGINVSPNLIPASARPTPQGNVPQNVNPNATKVNPNAPPAAPAAPAAPAPDSYEAMLRDSLKNSPKERSIESIIAEQNAIDKALGLDVPAGKDKLERIEEMKRQYAATQLSPMDELISMLGKSGQYKGLSGLAPAYTSMAEKKRAADAAQAKSINELMSGVEDTQRGEKTATKTKVGTAREKDIENARLFDREKMSTLGTARGQDVQAASAKYNADMSYKSAMAQMANANARQDVQEKRLLLDSFKTRIASIDKELIPLEKSFLKKDKELAEQLRGEKAGLTKALDETSGIGKMTAAPSAASPSGTTRMRFDTSGNQIK